MRNNPEYPLNDTTWHRSSYSDASGGNCLEVAEGHPTLVPVRDSKNLGPVIAFGAVAWAVFVGHVGSDG
ncbi:DUF397 domain-containing protein [Streptomyces sp. NPDC006173]|uniref:DUF397 domain-containing protein n=1 Tax=unclassified Streptomyces TaxID=2593676 RepID=UPI0033CA9AE5